MNNNTRYVIKGLTLVELMITISVLAIVLSVAVPPLNTFLARSELTSASNKILGNIHYLRSEAIVRNSTTVLCPSSNGSLCNTTDWSLGWIAYEDKNQDGKLATDGTEEIFSVTNPLNNYFSMKTTSGLMSSIQYKSDGTLKSNQGSIIICHANSPKKSNTRIIEISSGGRANISTNFIKNCQA